VSNGQEFGCERPQYGLARQIGFSKGRYARRLTAALHRPERGTRDA